MITLLDKYSNCLVTAAQAGDPESVQTVADLGPLKPQCRKAWDDLNAYMPIEYLGPIMDEVEATTVEIIQQNGG